MSLDGRGKKNESEEIFVFEKKVKKEEEEEDGGGKRGWTCTGLRWYMMAGAGL